MSPNSTKRTVIFVVVSIAAVVLGFFTFSPETATRIVQVAGYWVIAAGVVLFAWAVFRIIREHCAGLRPGRATWTTGGLILLLSGLIQVHEETGFKVVMDEVVLLGTSLQMHLEKEVQTPLRGYEINGAFKIVGGYLDKRPILFPFLVSVLHDLTGYRPNNIFMLNAILSILLFGLTFRLGSLLGGRRAGLLALLLLAGVPLVGQAANGAGLEILNLVLLMTVLILGVLYYDRPNDSRLVAFAYGGILLAQVRYESVILIIPIGILILLGWRKARRVLMPWQVIVAPLVLTIYPLQYEVLKQRPERWQLDFKGGSEEVFSLAYLPDNLGHAMMYFFDWTRLQPNSLFLTVFGILGGLFFLLRLLRNEERRFILGERGPAILCLGGGLIALSLLLLCYFWGQFDDPIVRRLSLPLHLLFIFPGTILLGKCVGRPSTWAGIYAITVLGLICQSIPTLSEGVPTSANRPARLENWKREFLLDHSRENFLMIDQFPLLWVSHRKSGISFRYLKLREEGFQFHFDHETFENIYVFQELTVDPLDSGRHQPYERFSLPAAYRLETVAEKQFEPFSRGRISRLIAIEGREARAYACFWMEHASLSDDQIIHAFRKEWARQLP